MGISTVQKIINLQLAGSLYKGKVVWYDHPEREIWNICDSRQVATLAVQMVRFAQECVVPL